MGARFCVYLFSKKFMPRHFAVLASSTTLTYIPFSFPVLYYNNMAYVCFLSSLFIWAAALTEKSENQFLVAGALLGLGVFSYPTLTATAAALYMPLICIKERKYKSKRFMGILTLGILIPCIAGASDFRSWKSQIFH